MCRKKQKVEFSTVEIIFKLIEPYIKFLYEWEVKWKCKDEEKNVRDQHLNFDFTSINRVKLE